MNGRPSAALLAELGEVISRAQFDEILARLNTSRERSLAEMRHLAEVIVPPPRRYASLSVPESVQLPEGQEWISSI